jgi:hypothetical protein
MQINGLIVLWQDIQTRFAFPSSSQQENVALSLLASDTLDAFRDLYTTLVTGRSYYLAYHTEDGQDRWQVHVPLPDEWIACLFNQMTSWGPNGGTANSFSGCVQELKRNKEQNPALYTEQLMNDATLVALNFAKFLNGQKWVADPSKTYNLQSAIDILERGI